jgi:hypothetical protein
MVRRRDGERREKEREDDRSPGNRRHEGEAPLCFPRMEIHRPRPDPNFPKAAHVNAGGRNLTIRIIAENKEKKPTESRTSLQQDQNASKPLRSTLDTLRPDG